MRKVILVIALVLTPVAHVSHITPIVHVSHITPIGQLQP